LEAKEFDVDAECDVLRLRAEVKALRSALRLENKKRQNAVCSIQTLLEKLSLADSDESEER
jgi:hypothetical protein